MWVELKKGKEKRGHGGGREEERKRDRYKLQLFVRKPPELWIRPDTPIGPD